MFGNDLGGRFSDFITLLVDLYSVVHTQHGPSLFQVWVWRYSDYPITHDPYAARHLVESQTYSGS